LEGIKLFVKTKKGTKGELYGILNASTGKINKIAPKEIDI
jgi:hypothetical protein